MTDDDQTQILNPVRVSAQDRLGIRITEWEDDHSIRSLHNPDPINRRSWRDETSVLPLQAIPPTRHWENDTQEQLAIDQARRRRSVLDTFVSMVAEFCVLSAVFSGGYVLWELYWTSLVAESKIVQALDDFSNKHPTPQPENFVEPEHHTDDVPGVDMPGYASIFGTLHIPRWNYMRIPMAVGTGDDVLDNGYAGWYDWTQNPGQLGNFALAAHRRTYGNSFRRVDALEVGDPVVVETADKFIVYEVSEKKIVTPDKSEVLYPVPEKPDAEITDRLLTMTTCHPEYDNYERYIVHSKFAYWTDKSQGKPGVIKDEDTINPTGRVDY